MQDCVGAGEVMSVDFAVSITQVDDLHAGDFVALFVGRLGVEKRELVAFAQRGQQDAGDCAAGAGEDDFSFGHGSVS